MDAEANSVCCDWREGEIHARSHLGLMLQLLTGPDTQRTERTSRNARHLDLIASSRHLLTPDPDHLDRFLPGKRGLPAEMPRRVATDDRRHAPPSQRQTAGDDGTESTR